ncbi:MAG: Hpt domain-containing protein [Gammaproteobacteria bacterium]|nr:Hpt domain-containing protein [Gammaproteobacteria bacterium]
MVDSINKNMIEELKELMGDDFQYLIETFLKDSELRLVDLDKAILESNATKIRELAHSFKGSSSTLGANKLSEISFIVESMGRDNILDNIDTANAELYKEYQIVKKYFNSII